MEINEAVISRSDIKTTLDFKIADKVLTITLTEDNPGEIKTCFNELIQYLKNGIFNFELKDQEEDLYHHICQEYINQLNTELNNVYRELGDYGLLTNTEDSPERKKRIAALG